MRRAVSTALSPDGSTVAIGQAEPDDPPRYSVSNELAEDAPAAASPTKQDLTLVEKVAAIKDELSLDSSLTFKAAVHEANKELGIEATGTIADQVAELICQLGINFAPAPATAEPLREQRERRESADRWIRSTIGIGGSQSEMTTR